MEFDLKIPISRRRVALIAALGVFVVILIILALRPSTVNVDLGAVTRGPLIVSVQDEGQTRVREVYTLSAPIIGRVRRIEAEVGDSVVAYETILANIQPTSPNFLDIRTRAQAEAAVKGAEAGQALAAADVIRVQAELDFSRAELGRAQSLFKRGNVSQSALDRAQLGLKTKEAALQTAQAALRIKEFELENAQATLIDPDTDKVMESADTCCIPIYAPVSGRVLQILHENEGVVSAGTPLIEIGDPQDLEIIVDLLSSDAVQVQNGADAFIEDWGGAQTLKARVRRVEPYGYTKVSALGIEEQRVNVILDLIGSAENWRSLGHGYRAEVRIVTWAGDNVLSVPLGALFRQGESWAVFVNNDGEASLRQISIGHRNEEEVEVLSGLDLGEQIILHPNDQIGDGTSIQARPQ